jgi:hypothetical protein
LNNLVHRADGRTPYQTLTGSDQVKIDVSNFHTFGCPCYVLDHHLQSGSSMIPKWKPRAQMSLYIGRSPSHAANVALIINPCTGHVSSQFHVIFDNYYTTVPYLCTATIPPYWADLVRAFSKSHVYTKRQVDTWQSLPEHIPENGDFKSEQTEVPNAVLGTHTNNAASSNFEGATIASIPAHLPVSQVVTFQDQNASENGNPQPNEWQMLESVNLHSSGLRRLSRLAALHLSETIKAHSTLPIKQGFLKVACLAQLSLFSAYDTMTVLVHAHQTIARTNPSLLTTAVNSFH